VIVGDWLYVGCGDGVLALDGITGEQRWSFTTGGSDIGHPACGAPVVFAGIAYFLADGFLYAINAHTGEAPRLRRNTYGHLVDDV
jgi:outer membrane protein assembly factor BamB